MSSAAPSSDFPDPHALKILRTTYWSSKGWVAKPKTAPDDFAYAQAAGLMFDPISADHDGTVARAIAARDALAPRQVAAGFLASLTTRRLDLRSALGSYAVVRHLAPHEHRSRRKNVRTCDVCGEAPASRGKEDLNELNFERFQWGGVRHDEPFYAAFDLERFAATPFLEPTAADVALLRAIVEAARSLPAKARPGKLEKALPTELPGNAQERRTLLAILGFAGVLAPAEHAGFRTAFTPYDERPETDDDWPYPVGWWRGSDGVSPEALDEWFGPWLT